MQKLYCYVDESGQDTHGMTFVVAAVVTKENRDTLLRLSEQFEEVSGKKKDKWGQAKHSRRMHYLRCVFGNEQFKGCLCYSVFRQTRDYDTATVAAIARMMKWKRTPSQYTSYIYIDGLTKTKRHEFGVRLRRFGVPMRHLGGIARDESHALMRLADAVAGFARDALTERSEEIQALFRKAKRGGMLHEVPAK